MWTWADFAQPGPGLSWLNLDRAKSKSNPKSNLDNPKMYLIHIQLNGLDLKSKNMDLDLR